MDRFLKISCILFLAIAFGCEIFSFLNGSTAEQLNCGPVDTIIMQKYNLPGAENSFRRSFEYCNGPKHLSDMIFFHEMSKWFFALSFFSLFALIAHRIKNPQNAANIAASANGASHHASENVLPHTSASGRKPRAQSNIQTRNNITSAEPCHKQPFSITKWVKANYKFILLDIGAIIILLIIGMILNK